MKTGILLGVGVLWGVAAWGADAIQPLDVKVGLWEVTHTTAVAGQPPIPQELLDKLTPEKRAKLEERMKERAAQGPKTITRKHCVTAEELKKSNMLGEDSKGCARTVITSTRRKLDARVVCTEKGGKRTGSYKIEAIDSKNVKGSVQMAASGGDRTMTVSSAFTGKWIGSVCGKDE
jgi:Protein of unknown function (DUF3617)